MEAYYKEKTEFRKVSVMLKEMVEKQSEREFRKETRRS